MSDLSSATATTDVPAKISNAKTIGKLMEVLPSVSEGELEAYPLMRQFREVWQLHCLHDIRIWPSFRTMVADSIVHDWTILSEFLLTLLSQDCLGRMEIMLEEESERGNAKVVRVLLEHGADVHSNDDLPLRSACTHGHLDTIRVLLEHGANIHSRGEQCLRRAARGKHSEAVKLLLKHGARADHLEEETQDCQLLIRSMQEQR